MILETLTVQVRRKISKCSCLERGAVKTEEKRFSETRAKVVIIGADFFLLE